MRRYQDSFAAANNMIVNQEPVTVGSIQDLGSIDSFLQDRAYLFGDDSSWAGGRSWRAFSAGACLPVPGAMLCALLGGSGAGPRAASARHCLLEWRGMGWGEVGTAAG